MEELEAEDIVNIKPKEVYARYMKWCENEGIDPTSNRIFNQNIEEKFNVKRAVRSLAGSSHRVYVPANDTHQ